MSKNIIELLQLAERVAQKSDVRYKIACLLVDENGEVVATGYNHHSEYPKKMGRMTVHAELDALSKVRKPSKNLTMFLYRNNNNPIHPCPCCSVLIKAYEIKNVFSFHTIKI